MNRILLGAVTLFCVMPMIVAAATPPDADEIAIRALQTRQMAAWNRHDADAYAALFNEDGDVVNVAGWWWRGRAAIRRHLTAAFAFVFHESTLTITDVDVRFLNPAIAIAHVRWTMEGARAPPGVSPPHQGIQLQTLEKRDGMWRIASFQNTNSIPEVPFPSGPSAPVRAPQ